MPEPWAPAGVTRSAPPSSGRRMPRWYSTRPGRLRSDSCVVARSFSSGGGSLSPASRSRAGRTNWQKVTITDTGLPGKPKNQAPPRRPKASGRPGLTATFQKRTSPSSPSASRT